jgi:hypothetical protein
MMVGFGSQVDQSDYSDISLKLCPVRQHAIPS